MHFGWRWSCVLAFAVAGVVSSPAAKAADWARFRGPNGSGVSTDKESLPAEWSDTENLKWKAELPGPGNSCPIVVGDKVFVTCWSGYADGSDGRQEDLKRHLVCIDRKTGKTLWDKTLDAVLPEDNYGGMFRENGYATHTPVSDGERVYVFYGKSGVHAYDMQGTHLWKADVGTDLDGRGWGSASSPILHKDLVIVTASVEHHAIVALDKKTGEKKWEQVADGFGSTWGTPVLVESGDKAELVIGVPYEIWALNPDTGKLLWYCDAIDSNSMCSSVTAHDGIVYGMESGPGGGGGVAVKVGGKGNVTESHRVWKNRDRNRVGTPVIHEGLMYYISSGVASAVDINTGEQVYQSRLQSSSRDDNRGGEGNRGGGSRGGGGFQFGGGGGRGGGQDYSSPIVADGKLFYAKRNGEIYVLKLGREFEQLAVNKFESADGDFNATPAVSNGQLFIRSNRTLYCVAEDAKKTAEK
jgi:outer membrane protein assembly factor BamB